MPDLSEFTALVEYGDDGSVAAYVERLIMENKRLKARASTLEDAAFHFQTCRRCKDNGEDSCESGRRFAACLRGDADGD